MAEDRITPITREAMLEGLGPLRLPEASGLWVELAICALIGLCLGLLLSRRAPKALTLAERLAALAGLAGEERRLGLLYLLRDLRPGVLRGWGDRLYRRGALPEADEIETELRRND